MKLKWQLKNLCVGVQKGRWQNKVGGAESEAQNENKFKDFLKCLPSGHLVESKNAFGTKTVVSRFSAI